METLIIICLLLVIVLLLQDRTITQKRLEKKEPKKELSSEPPDIMGPVRTISGHMMSKSAVESQNDEDQREADTFETEKDEQGVDVQIPQEDLDEVFGDGPDLEEEEKEWNRYGISGGDNGFTTGVTFQELDTVGMLLQQKVLEPSQEKTITGLVQKIQGTELFSLLENSIEGASQRIAELLDRSLCTEADSGSSILRNNDVNNFDIGEFV